MSDAGSRIGYYAAGLMVVNIVGAALVLRRPHKTAEANRAFIESGKEAYFEQRRAWQAYGATPQTDPNRLRRGAILTIALNLAALALIVALEWLL